jgi:hypothetical protein
VKAIPMRSTCLKVCLALVFVCFTANTSLAAEDAPAPAPNHPTSRAAAMQAAKKRMSFAVVVGNNESLGGRRPNLHYADDDAARYFQIFQTIAPGNVSLLSKFDRDTQRLFPEVERFATPATIGTLNAVGQHLASQVRAANQAGHETEVYFVFAGHGDVAQGEGFIELADTAFRSSELQEWLRAIPFTRAHVILDSCNSFFMLGVRKPGGRHFATSEDAARALSERLPNVGVFLSTSAEGEAFEWSEIQSGIFSHLVRSGLMGAADANHDGAVSYLELAAFVDTATTDVRNPNMRPHVFARGPGASDTTPIARPAAMTAVRRFELSDADVLRVRVRDRDGLPLFDAHTEPGGMLQVAMPDAWALGAIVERTRRPSNTSSEALRRWYTLPEPPETVTLAALSELTPSSTGRGPDETFHLLFAQPFGQRAFGAYLARRRSAPPPVYGVSQEDLVRMQLVLDQVARAERGKRLHESLGGLGVGALLVGAGIGVLHVDEDASSKERREAHWIGGGLLGMSALFIAGGVGPLLAPSRGEETASTFRSSIGAGGDPGQAFATADETLQELAKVRHEERMAQGVVGAVVMLGATTGFIWGELSNASSGRMARRLGWGGTFLGGGLMLGEAIWAETPADTLTRIWRDDPSLNQYQTKTSIGVSHDGAFLNVTGRF